MTKRTIEIEDDLDERIENMKAEIRDDFIDYLEENPDITDFDDYYQNSGCDKVNESADSNTPIYYSNIDALYYLYSGDFEESYNNAGLYDKQPDNYKQVCICLYLEEQGYEYLRELETLFDEHINNAETNTPILDLINELNEE